MTQQGPIITEPSPSTRTDEAMLLDYLRDHDAPCPVCKYNLRALSVPRCPECGRSLKLSIGTIEPYLKAWIVLTIATFASTGIAVLMDVFITYQRPPMHFHWHEIVGLFSFNVSIPPAILALVLRRTFLRWHPAVQWLLAIFFLLLTVGQIFCFVIWIK